MTEIKSRSYKQQPTLQCPINWTCGLKSTLIHIFRLHSLTPMCRLGETSREQSTVPNSIPNFLATTKSRGGSYSLRGTRDQRSSPLETTEQSIRRPGSEIREQTVVKLTMTSTGLLTSLSMSTTHKSI